MMNTTARPLRLWPGIGLAAVMLISFFVVPVALPEAELPYGLIGAALAAVGIVVWWLLFSRAAWIERIAALVLAVLFALGVKQLSHLSIAGAGQGILPYLLSALLMTFGLVIWAAATQRFSNGVRRATLPLALALACMPLLIVRTAGVTSTTASGAEYHWRWTPTPEELLLARGNEPLAPPPAATSSLDEAASNAAGTTPQLVEPHPAPTPAAPAAPEAVAPQTPKSPQAPRVSEWPGFRGPLRDGVIRNLRISTDWSASPPVEMWQRAIGPGWSSFAVRGDLLYTQEQRGDNEMVTCYRVSTGQPVWRHSDAVRFWESNGGAGPRGTPAIHGDRVFAFGATGLLKALDAITGKPAWIADVSADTKRAVPIWGFASSPLVIDDLVIVAAAGTLAAYDVNTGTVRWKGPSYGGSYSSPHRLTLDGVEQVVLLGGPGAVSVSPADGKVLWQHKWEPGPMVQPALTGDGDILVNNVTATGGVATRRLHVTRSGDGWNIEERWTSNGLKPNFNDFVVHEGHAYGFDNNILAAINLETGERVWKGGRYGNGQLVLLQDQDLLMVTSEDGDLALVSATPDKYTEVAKMPILEGKTWNHPVIVRDILLVRNGEQMKAFKLPVVAENTAERLP
jgi:outer membrane protein assembly factor BamB